MQQVQSSIMRLQDEQQCSVTSWLQSHESHGSCCGRTPRREMPLPKKTSHSCLKFDKTQHCREKVLRPDVFRHALRCRHFPWMIWRSYENVNVRGGCSRHLLELVLGCQLGRTRRSQSFGWYGHVLDVYLTSCLLLLAPRRLYSSKSYIDQLLQIQWTLNALESMLSCFNGGVKQLCPVVCGVPSGSPSTRS